MFDVENHAGTPVYVHAKVCVVDDVWVSVGSDNFNRRSWTHDSELSSAVLDTTRDPREPRDPAGTGDGARTFARDLRLTLAREHLDLAADGSEDDDLLDPERFVADASTRARRGPRDVARGRPGRPPPPGRLRPHQAEKLPLFTRLWATPLYRLVDDPDGRPLRLRLKKELLTRRGRPPRLSRRPQSLCRHTSPEQALQLWPDAPWAEHELCSGAVSSPDCPQLAAQTEPAHRRDRRSAVRRWPAVRPRRVRPAAPDPAHG